MTASPEKEYQHSHSSSSSSSIYSLHDDSDLLPARSGSPQSQHSYSSSRPFVIQAPKSSPLADRLCESPTLGVPQSTRSMMHASKPSMISISRPKPYRSDSAVSPTTPAATATATTDPIAPSRTIVDPTSKNHAPSDAIPGFYDSYWDTAKSAETSKHQKNHSRSLTPSKSSALKVNPITTAVPLNPRQSPGASNSSPSRPLGPATMSLMPKPDPRQTAGSHRKKVPAPLEMEILRGMAPQPQKVVLVEPNRKVVSGAAITMRA